MKIRTVITVAGACGLALLAGVIPASLASSSGHGGQTAQPSVQALSSAKFEPDGASFISPSTGWVLGHPSCSNCAAAVFMTSDGGDQWIVLKSPAPLAFTSASAHAVSNIAFADRKNGFLYGPGLWGTHDGGQSWSSASLPVVRDLAVGQGYAYAVTANRANAPSLWRNALGTSHWIRLTLPRAAARPVDYNDPNGPLLVYTQGRTIVLLRPGFTGPMDTAATTGDLWVSTTAGALWNARTMPCHAPADGGAAVLGIALSHPDTWLLDCFNNEQSSQEQDTQHIVFETVNGGRSWIKLPRPPQHNMPQLLADNGAGHLFLATQGVYDFMTGTLDNGLRWHRAITGGQAFNGWANLGFVSARVGFVVVRSVAGPGALYRTVNGGQTWRMVRF
jgi:photosystem II stability/assembly factor-like uncharacterized protein